MFNALPIFNTLRALLSAALHYQLNSLYILAVLCDFVNWKGRTSSTGGKLPPVELVHTKKLK
jgi:hypothetical protein